MFSKQKYLSLLYSILIVIYLKMDGDWYGEFGNYIGPELELESEKEEEEYEVEGRELDVYRERDADVS